MYYYKVDCWVPPKSGFDIQKKNQAFNFIEELANKLPDGSGKKIKEYLEGFREESKGMVLKSLTLESDTPVGDPEIEFMEAIIKESPEARIANWELIDAPIMKKPV
jgi:hypothetical protein